jgi:cobalamin biosynthesis protein CobD/CbiB
MPGLLMLAGGVGLVAATAALWLQGRERTDHRLFAGLISIGVTLSLFSVVAWAATAIAQVAPLPLTWVLVSTLALLFALRLYREL